MWSVLRERIEVYLGTGLVLVQRPHVPLWSFEPPATLPLIDVLRHVDRALNRAEGRPWRVCVHLSAALCPSVAFALPTGVKRHHEVLALAQASAAQSWFMSADQATEIVCSLDARHLTLAAAMLAGTHRVITQWATEHKGRLASLRPLWAAATSANACAGSQRSRVAILEPDALTVLNLSKGSAVRAVSLPGRFEATEARSYLIAASDQPDEAEQREGVAMLFNREPAQTGWPQGPAVWAHHWRHLS